MMQNKNLVIKKVCHPRASHKCHPRVFLSGICRCRHCERTRSNLAVVGQVLPDIPRGHCEVPRATKQSSRNIKNCHPRFCRPQDSGISTLFSSSPLEGEGGTQCRVRGKSFIFTTRFVTPTLRAAIYAGYSRHSGFTPCRHPELDSGSRCFMKKEEALNKSSFRAPLRSGFTLIELLVVVLIIGILAAVAVPQYQKAVDKVRTSELFAIVKNLKVQQEVFYLANGHYAADCEELGADMPSGFENTGDNNIFTLTKGNITISLTCSNGYGTRVRGGIKSADESLWLGIESFFDHYKDEDAHIEIDQGRQGKNFCASVTPPSIRGAKVCKSLGKEERNATSWWL